MDKFHVEGLRDAFSFTCLTLFCEFPWHKRRFAGVCWFVLFGCFWGVVLFGLNFCC